MSAAQPRGIAEEIFVGDSEMAALMRAHDWSQTCLGAVEHWPESLKIALNICLNSRFPMVIWWGNALTLLYNDAWRPILGNKHPQALGKPGQEVWAEIWDIVGIQLNSVLTTGKATWSDDQLLLVNRHGYTEEAYFTYSYSPIFLETGAVGGAFTAVAETTQRVIGARRLATLRNLADQTGQSKTVEQACQMVLYTLSQNFFDLPLALLYLLNAEGTQATLQTQTPAQVQPLIAPAELDLTQPSNLFAQALASVIQSNQPFVLENLGQYWGEFPVGSSHAPLQQAIALPIRASTQGSMVGVLVLGVNPYQALDNDQHQFLEMTAGHIANAITSAQAYEEERKRAEALAELDRAKTAFFSNVSHEFRTPLTLMLSPLEEILATDGIIPPEQQQQIELVHRNSLRLLKLVNTLLDFSRIEAGRVQAVYQPTDLAAFTAELASMFRSAIEKAGLQLIVACKPLSETVYVDREMWEKIVLNLLSNAFKFTFSGKIAVTLRQWQNQVELAVRDTGIGIPTAELPHLFERFHRVEGARGRTQEGSGIGLALVQELVRLHGGQVEVKSIEGKGTTFTVTIPTGMAHLPPQRIQATRTASTALGAIPYVEEALRWLPEAETKKSNGRKAAGEAERDEPAGEAFLAFSSLPSSAPLASSASPSCILLVDDNTDMRNYVKRLLLSQGYEVETAADGMAALAMTQQQIPDLVLTDVMMPRLDGFGLLRELRTSPTTREIPIILLSARAGEEARVEGLAAGADDYLIKPFSARELLARVEANLKLAQLRQAATQKEQALRMEVQTAKNSLESVLTRIADQFLALDREWRYTYVNDRVTEVTGIARENLLGRSLWDVFPGLVGSQFEQEVHRAVAEQTPVQFEYFYPIWNRWFENYVYPSADGVSMIVTDVTERKQTERALRQSEERLSLALSAAAMGTWDTDLRTNRTVWSEEHFRLLGYPIPPLTERQVTIEMWRSRVHPDDLDAVMKAWREAKTSGTPYAPSYRIIRANDHEIRWLEVLGRFIYDETTNKAVRFIGMVWDITERKQTETERERLLQQAKTAQETAETANRIKDEFLAVLSHELRSPLNPILGWSRLLQTRQFDQQGTQRALETIERNAKLQTQLIEDLLDVSRILRGKMALNVHSVNLITVVESALETVRLAAEAKQLQIQTVICLNHPQVAGDAARLQQIIWNLLSNAVKFTSAGGRVEVKVEGGIWHHSSRMGETVEHSSSDYVQITISDTGKGISPDFLPYVFDQFRQEDGRTTRKFGGLGLGLAIVRYLTELHGGTVHAESLGEEQGATFIVRLPLITGGAASSEKPSPVQSVDLSQLRVLLVDDDEDMRELVQVILEQQGAQVTVAASAAEALIGFDRQPPDVLISDIGMPEVDGYMLMQQIRSRSAKQGGLVPAIALTAYAGEYDQQQALKAGFQRHVAKPVEPEILVKQIVALINS